MTHVLGNVKRKEAMQVVNKCAKAYERLLEEVKLGDTGG